MAMSVETRAEPPRPQEPGGLSPACLWLGLSCAALTIAIGFPGSLGIDSQQQLQAALEHRFYAWHPPAMVALWIVFNAVIVGPFLMLTLQAGAWWLGLALIVRRGFPSSPALQVASLLAFGLFPPCFGHVAHISKDAQMMTVLVLGVGVLIDSEARRKRWPLWLGVALLLYGSSVRYNGLAAVLPFVLWIPLRLGSGPLGTFSASGRRFAAAGSALLLLGGGFAINTLLLPRGAGETPLTQTIFYDLVGISSRTGRNLLPDPQGAPARSATAIDELYASGWAKIFADGRNRIALQPPHSERARQLWRSALLTSPGTYLRHRLYTFGIATGLIDGPKAYVTIPWSWKRVELFYPSHGLEVRSGRSPLSKLVRVWLGWTVEHFPIMFRSWPYLLLGGLLLAGSALQRLRSAPIPVPNRALLLLSSAWLYSGTYLVAGGQPNLRFHLWSVAACAIALLLLLRELRTPRREA